MKPLTTHFGEHHFIWPLRYPSYGALGHSKRTSAACFRPPPLYLGAEAYSRIDLTRDCHSLIAVRGTLGLYANGSGVGDDMIREETGAELLEYRRAKLKLGYWRRVFSAQQGRLARVWWSLGVLNGCGLMAEGIVG